ncbi:hypothetical protein ACHAWU_004543 [Discostella pseudostelligera]|uniref:G-patch domain-containing protein n=1 Tax=Discostella pseudostelligera TaxID=259834 RepID=A0ABD3MSV4_9STRA
MSDNHDDDDAPNNSNLPISSTSGIAIAYTRQRKFTKTRNAASSARFRQNMIRSSGGGSGGGKESDAWFARKSAGWTDDAIRSHIVGGGSGGTGNNGEEGFGMIGDIIQGVGVGTTTTDRNHAKSVAGDENEEQGSNFRRRKKSRNSNRRVGTRFAWEEEEEENDDIGEGDQNDIDGGSNIVYKRGRMMAPPPPTLKDIMDEQDEIDFASRTLRVHQHHQQQHHNGNGEDKDQRKGRRKNAALEELARISSGNINGKSCSNNMSSIGSVGSIDGSIGYRLLRALGYRSMLGMAIVPSSSSRRHKQQQQQQGIDDDGENYNDNILLSKELSSRELSKWLSSRGLRAIRLPSIFHITNDNDRDGSAKSHHDQQQQHQLSKQQRLLTIPPPKLDRHGIGYDPFANAPEFREFRERRLARARMLGRGNNTSVGEEENDVSRGVARRNKRNGEEKYFTDNLREDGRRALWDKRTRDDHHDSDDGGSDDDFEDVVGNRRRIQQSSHHHHHYAADRDYSDFVGTKSSSGFALEEDDDADVYNQDEIGNDHDGKRRGGAGGEYYTTEVQSPVASDAEDQDLFGLHSSSQERLSMRKKRQRCANSNGDDQVNQGGIVEAWSAWGTDGVTAETSDANPRTMDGKPPLSGFVIGKPATSGSSNASPMRWKGPSLPSGYVLQRHVFRDEGICSGIDDVVGVNEVDGSDCGLGLDFQRRRQQRQRRQIPTVFPPSFNQQKMQPTITTTSATPGKMLARDGTELNFHAVRESMKSRFVTSSLGSTNDAGDARGKSTTTAIDDAAVAKAKNLDEEEWIQISITPWIPTRLLCKRWGVPVPSSIEGMSECLGGVVGSSTTRVRSNEETYFRDMVYDPAVADRSEKNGGTIEGGAIPLAPTVDRENVTRTLDDDGDDLDDMAGRPPPTRPSVEIFRSIFDADESDMDISTSSSSSDDDENEVSEKVVDRASNNADQIHEVGNGVEDGVTHAPAAPTLGGMIAKKGKGVVRFRMDSRKRDISIRQ